MYGVEAVPRVAIVPRRLQGHVGAGGEWVYYCRVLLPLASSED